MLVNNITPAVDKVLTQLRVEMPLGVIFLFCGFQLTYLGQGFPHGCLFIICFPPTPKLGVLI